MFKLISLVAASSPPLALFLFHARSLLSRLVATLALDVKPSGRQVVVYVSADSSNCNLQVKCAALVMATHSLGYSLTNSLRYK